MDGELDLGMRVRRHPHNFAAARAAFDQQLKVNRAPLISAKAVIERVIEPLQTHVRATTRIAPIQKRTVIGTRIPGITAHARILNRTPQDYRRFGAVDVNFRRRESRAG